MLGFSGGILTHETFELLESAYEVLNTQLE
jgi:hypothetical protein